MKGALPKTTPEQRAPLYEDLELFLSPGFLSHTVEIGPVKLALRTLNPGDMFLLRSRVGEATDEDWRLWIIASAVWVVNGYTLLGQHNAAVGVVRVLDRLPHRAIDKLFSVMLALFARQSKALQAVEPYCYESISRFNWRTYGGHPLPLHAGIEGAESLGANNIQRMWTFYNDVEDQRVRDEALWEGFKLSASAMSPKGVKKIDQKDRQIRQQEDERRQALQDKFFYLAKGILTPEGETQDGEKVAKLGSKSADDLADEMYRWVSGDEDEHDRIVGAYKRKVIQSYEQEKRERAARIKAIRERQETESSLSISNPLTGYTPEQLQELLKGRGPGTPGVRELPAVPHAARDYLYNRHLEKGPDSGLLRPVEGRLVPAEGKDLTDQLVSRGVPFRTEEDDS